MADGTTTYAFGEHPMAYADYSQAIGRYSRTNHEGAYVWSGLKFPSSTPASERYRDSNADGSYNIYPINGISGFYIDGHNFVECVLSAVQSMDDIQKEQFKTALGL